MNLKILIRTRLIFILTLVILFTKSLVYGQEIISVTGNQNNVLIQEVRLRVDGELFVQTLDMATRANPAKLAIPVVAETILLANGREIIATTRFPEAKNLHPNIGSNTIAADKIGIIKPPANYYTSHRNANFKTELEEVVSIPDLRSYWDIGAKPSIPTGGIFADIIYPEAIPLGGYLIVSERFGNSKMQIQALGVSEALIPGSKTLQIDGYQWDTRVNHVTNQTNQTQFLVAVSPSLFEASEPIFGFRIINLGASSDPDGKIVFFRNTINASEDEVITEQGTQVQINLGENDLLGGEEITLDNNVFYSLAEPSPYFTINNDGTFTVLSSAPEGSYSLAYTICEAQNPSNCSTSTVNVQVAKVLPVSWLYISAEALEIGNKISWATANEKNNWKFIIRFSFDGKNWELAGEKEAVGNTDEISHYEYLHNAPPTNMEVYYQIEQIDFDMRSEKSIVFRLLKDRGLIKPNFIIFPNPYISGDLTLLVPKSLLEKDGSVIVENQNGSVISSRDGLFKNIANNLSEQLKTFPAGIYFIKIQNENRSELLKLIKK